MNMAELRSALHALPLNLPHGNVPEFDWDTEITEAVWDATDWNPPLGFCEPERGPDPLASAKPTWDRLVRQVSINNGEPQTVEEARARRMYDLRYEGQRRITAAYGERLFEDEVALRLRGGHTPAQDVERNRLRTKYHEIKRSIEALSTIESVMLFDIGMDERWR